MLAIRKFGAEEETCMETPGNADGGNKRRRVWSLGDIKAEVFCAYCPSCCSNYNRWFQAT